MAEKKVKRKMPTSDKRKQFEYDDVVRMLEQGRVSLKTPWEITSLEVFKNLVDPVWYELDKAVRSFLKFSSPARRTANGQTIVPKLLFAHLFGEPYDEKARNHRRLYDKLLVLLDYYCSMKAGPPITCGKQKFWTPVYYIGPAAKRVKQPPFSYKLRIEEYEEQEKKTRIPVRYKFNSPHLLTKRKFSRTTGKRRKVKGEKRKPWGNAARGWHNIHARTVQVEIMEELARRPREDHLKNAARLDDLLFATIQDYWAGRVGRRKRS